MGSRIVGAGKTVALTVKTSGIDDGEAAEIQVFKSKDNSSLDTLSSKVKNKTISADWVAKGPDPEGDEESWEVYYKATCKGLETKATKMVVYCDWVEVSSVDEEGSALPDATFRVIAGQERRERNTGSSGVRKEEYLPFGPITVEWLKPYHLIEWVDEKGPKRKAKVKKVPPAVLVSPKKGAHTQYVNMPADEAFPELGHTLKVKVTLEGGKAGDKVYAKLTPGEKNSKRNDPKPEFVGGTTAAWCPDGGIEAELAGDAGTPDCEAVLELECGLAGGDVFVLSVGGSEECADETLTITNWRRIFYQITRAADSQLPDPSVMQAALKDVYIEYDQYHEAIVADADVPAGSFMSASDLGRGSGKLLVVGNHNLDQLKSKFQDDKTPIGAHVIVCDAQYDGGEPGSWHEQTIVAEAEFGKKTVTIDEPDLYDVFATAIQNGEPSLQAGSTWESLAPGGHADAGKQGELTADMVVFGVGRTPDKVQVVLPPEAAAVTAGGNKVKLTLKLLVARGPFLGEATEKHQLVVRLPDDAAMNGVLVHELGHALKQALAEVAPGMVEADHGRTYTEHGHQGHHCANGLSDADFAETDYTFKTGACVMFGGGATDAGPPNDGKFCDKCRPFVLAEACDVVNSDGGKLVVAPEDIEADTDTGSPTTGTYRITLRLGDLSALCDDPATEAGRQQRMQMLGLLYEPLGGAGMATRYPAALEHFRNVLASPAADEATAQAQLVDLLGKDLVRKVGAAADAASELPGPGEFARIRLPGGFALPRDDSSALGYPVPHGQRFRAEETFYAANTRVGALPIIAKVEVESGGSWNPAPAGLQVHFQLALPDALPAGNEAAAPDLRTETRVRNTGAGTPLGPARYVPAAIASGGAVAAGDPQVDNCPVTHGGKRRPGAGQAADYFETADRAGFNTVNGTATFPVAQASPRPLAVMATTNAQGEAGVIFRPSRQGGDRFKLRAFLDPLGPGGPASDGTDAAAVKAETGTLVVWRTLRISRYLVFDYPAAVNAATRNSSGGALGTIDFEGLKNEYARCYIDLIIERTAAREAHVIGDAEWVRMIDYARANTPRRPAHVGQNYNIGVLIPRTNATKGLVRVLSATDYDAARGASPAANQARDYWWLVNAVHERCIEYYSKNATSGLVVIQAPEGDSLTAANAGTYSTSGVATTRRGAFLFYGNTVYRNGMPYDLDRNTLHELGHVLFFPHQWTDRYDRLNFTGLAVAGFTSGERVTGAPSGAAGVVTNGAWAAGAGTLDLAQTSGTFAAGDTLTGATSGGTASFTSYAARGAVGGGVPVEHDYRDYCIMSYQRNVTNEYDYCGRCNMKLRGWNTSAIPRNVSGWPR
jgi:hypothetical protein